MLLECIVAFVVVIACILFYEWMRGLLPGTKSR